MWCSGFPDHYAHPSSWNFDESRGLFQLMVCRHDDMSCNAMGHWTNRPNMGSRLFSVSDYWDMSDYFIWWSSGEIGTESAFVGAHDKGVSGTFTKAGIFAFLDDGLNNAYKYDNGS